MVTEVKQSKVKVIAVEFADEPVTAFGGLALVEEVARRVGLWRDLERGLPAWARGIDWLTTIKSVVTGLLTGSQGTYAAEDLRGDEAALELLGLDGAPEEVTVWRSLGRLGGGEMLEALGRVQRQWARRLLQRGRMRDLLMEGFFPLFGDGTLLEGSDRREGTKVIEGKGGGLLWTTLFAGPVLAGQHLAADGEGEQSSLRGLLSEVLTEVVEPLKLKRRALVLLDSLHGDGPTLEMLESEHLMYIVGANKLKETERTLSEQPACAWQDTGPQPQHGWVESAVCGRSAELSRSLSWLQTSASSVEPCREWTEKRMLVGRRWRRERDLPGIYHYAGVATDVAEEKVAGLMGRREISYGEAIWYLYDRKAGLENHYKDLLADLALHYPPCQEHVRNAGFYALGALAHTLGRSVQLLAGPLHEAKSPDVAGGKETQRPPATGQGREQNLAAKRHRPKPRWMRLWRFRRRLLTLPARIAYHARTVTVTLLGVCQTVRCEFQHFWSACCRC